MKKLYALMLCIALCFGAVGACAQEALTDGEYQAAAQGNNGDVNVTVTIADGKIAAVEVGEHAETAGICEAPIESIPQAIVDGQTLAVDVVSGATNTSNAILAAVASCIEQAGGDPAAYQTAAAEASDEVQTIEADVVVVGGGMAGVAAALGAVENGANVVVLEKQGVLGGSAALAGGNFAVAGTQYETDAGFDNSIDAAIERLKVRAEADAKQSGYPDYDKLRFVLEGAADNIAWLEENGMVFGDIMEPGTELARLRTRIPDSTNNGAAMIAKLIETAESKGVTFMTDCAANALLLEDGKVAGVTAKDGAVTVHAPTVVLACGGFGHNQEMMEEYIPEYAGATCTSAAGNTGDGFVMAEQVNAAFYDNPWVIAAGPVLSSELTAACDTSAVAYTAGLSIDAQGERLVNETAQYSVVSNAVAWNGGEALFLYDSSDEAVASVMETAVTLGEAFKGETIEELATAAGIDPQTLVATVERFNGYAAAGVDEELGKAAASMTALENGPFYAVKFYPSYMGTIAGVVTNDDAQVINTDGEVIEGLYAAGEMSNRPYYNYGYYSAASLQIYSQMGHIAGVNAAQEALQ